MRVEMFASSSAKPEDLWALVSDVRRLPEWTDADGVEEVPEPPVAPGAEFVTIHGDERLRWRLLTLEQRLIEARAKTPRAALSVGARVVRETVGSRLVLAASYEPVTSSGLRARLVELPALRRRLERWCATAAEVAGPHPAP